MEQNQSLPINQTEYKTLTRDAQWIGTALLLVLALSSIGGMLFPLLLHLIWPTGEESGGVLYQAALYVLSSPFSILPAFCIAAKACNRSFQQVLPFRAVPFLQGMGCVLLGFWGIVLGNVISDGAEWLFPYADENLTMMMGASAQTPVELAAELLYICLVPAFVEEFAFRGVTLFTLRRYGDWFAILVSALLFGVFHGNVIQLPFAFCLGVAAGYITLRTDSLWPAITLHFINNAISCLLGYFGGSVYSLLGSYTNWVLYAVWFVMGLVGWLLLRSRRATSNLQNQPQGEGTLTVGGRLLALLKAYMLILALLVNLIAAVILIYPVMQP